MSRRNFSQIGDHKSTQSRKSTRLAKKSNRKQITEDTFKQPEPEPEPETHPAQPETGTHPAQPEIQPEPQLEPESEPEIVRVQHSVSKGKARQAILTEKRGEEETYAPASPEGIRKRSDTRPGRRTAVVRETSDADVPSHDQPTTVAPLKHVEPTKSADEPAGTSNVVDALSRDQSAAVVLSEHEAGTDIAARPIRQRKVQRANLADEDSDSSLSEAPASVYNASEPEPEPEEQADETPPEKPQPRRRASNKAISGQDAANALAEDAPCARKVGMILKQRPETTLMAAYAEYQEQESMRRQGRTVDPDEQMQTVASIMAIGSKLPERDMRWRVERRGMASKMQGVRYERGSPLFRYEKKKKKAPLWFVQLENTAETDRLLRHDTREIFRRSPIFFAERVDYKDAGFQERVAQALEHVVNAWPEEFVRPLPNRVKIMMFNVSIHHACGKILSWPLLTPRWSETIAWTAEVDFINEQTGEPELYCPHSPYGIRLKNEPFIHPSINFHYQSKKGGGAETMIVLHKEVKDGNATFRSRLPERDVRQDPALLGRKPEATDQELKNRERVYQVGLVALTGTVTSREKIVIAWKAIEDAHGDWPVIKRGDDIELRPNRLPRIAGFGYLRWYPHYVKFHLSPRARSKLNIAAITILVTDAAYLAEALARTRTKWMETGDFEAALLTLLASLDQALSMMQDEQPAPIRQSSDGAILQACERCFSIIALVELVVMNDGGQYCKSCSMLGSRSDDILHYHANKQREKMQCLIRSDYLAFEEPPSADVLTSRLEDCLRDLAEQQTGCEAGHYYDGITQRMQERHRDFTSHTASIEAIFPIYRYPGTNDLATHVPQNLVTTYYWINLFHYRYLYGIVFLIAEYCRGEQTEKDRHDLLHAIEPLHRVQLGIPMARKQRITQIEEDHWEAKLYEMISGNSITTLNETQQDLSRLFGFWHGPLRTCGWDEEEKATDLSIIKEIAAISEHPEKLVYGEDGAPWYSDWGDLKGHTYDRLYTIAYDKFAVYTWQCNRKWSSKTSRRTLMLEIFYQAFHSRDSLFNLPITLLNGHPCRQSVGHLVNAEAMTIPWPLDPTSVDDRTPETNNVLIETQVENRARGRWFEPEHAQIQKDITAIFPQKRYYNPDLEVPAHLVDVAKDFPPIANSASFGMIHNNIDRSAFEDEKGNMLTVEGEEADEGQEGEGLFVSQPTSPAPGHSKQSDTSKQAKARNADTKASKAPPKSAASKDVVSAPPKSAASKDVVSAPPKNAAPKDVTSAPKKALATPVTSKKDTAKGDTTVNPIIVTDDPVADANRWRQLFGSVNDLEAPPSEEGKPLYVKPKLEHNHRDLYPFDAVLNHIVGDYDKIYYHNHHRQRTYKTDNVAPIVNDLQMPSLAELLRIRPGQTGLNSWYTDDSVDAIQRMLNRQFEAASPDSNQFLSDGPTNLARFLALEVGERHEMRMDMSQWRLRMNLVLTHNEETKHKKRSGTYRPQDDDELYPFPGMTKRHTMVTGIINQLGNHWVTFRFIIEGGGVNIEVYDSMNGVASHPILEGLLEILAQNEATPFFGLKHRQTLSMRCQQQKGGRDCGAMALDSYRRLVSGDPMSALDPVAAAQGARMKDYAHLAAWLGNPLPEKLTQPYAQSGLTPREAALITPASRLLETVAPIADVKMIESPSIDPPDSDESLQGVGTWEDVEPPQALSPELGRQGTPTPKPRASSIVPPSPAPIVPPAIGEENVVKEQTAQPTLLGADYSNRLFIMLARRQSRLITEMADLAEAGATTASVGNIHARVEEYSSWIRQVKDRRVVAVDGVHYTLHMLPTDQAELEDGDAAVLKQAKADVMDIDKDEQAE